MAYSTQKSQTAKVVVAILLIMLLTACTSDQHYKYQANGDEAYLKTSPLRALSIPFGMTLPLQNREYKISAVPCNGAVGKRLDIRPPV